MKFMTIFGKRERKLEKIYPRHFIKRRLDHARGRTRMITRATALQTKAAEKHQSIRKAVEGSSSLGNDAASAAEYKPPIESLFLFLLLQLLLLL